MKQKLYDLSAVISSKLTGFPGDPSYQEEKIVSLEK
jgi:kynurenine formamidase